MFAKWYALDRARGSHAGLAALLGLALAVQVGCSDASGPGEAAGESSGSPSLDIGDGGPPPPGTLTVTLGAGVVGGEGQVAPVTMGSYAEATLVEVVAEGVMTKYMSDFRYLWGDGAGQVASPAYDPGGYYTYGVLHQCTGNVYLQQVYGGRTTQVGYFCDPLNALPLAATWRDTIVVKGEMRAGRYRGYPGSTAYPCSAANKDPCFIWTGSQTVTTRPIAEKLKVTVSRSSVIAGDSVTFTASTTGGVAFTVREWLWQPDSAASGGGLFASRARPRDGAVRESRAARRSASLSATTVASCGTATTCSVPVNESGRMYVRAWVTNRVETAKAGVVAEPDTLRLVADPSAGPAGTTVTFTPGTAHGRPYTVQSWTWIPDSVPTQSQPCPSSADPCVTTIQESGTMVVMARVGDETQTARARMTIARCATGDPILDSPEVRDTLKKAWHDSGFLDSLPMSRRELGGVIYRRSDGSYFAFPIPGAATPCSYTIPAGGIPVIPGSIGVGYWHLHPHALEEVTCDPSNPGSKGMADPLGNGGGSDGDWKLSNSGFPVYVMNPVKLVRLDPNTPLLQRKHNPNRWPWWNPSCPIIE